MRHHTQLPLETLYHVYHSRHLLLLLFTEKEAANIKNYPNILKLSGKYRTQTQDFLPLESVLRIHCLSAVQLQGQPLLHQTPLQAPLRWMFRIPLDTQYFPLSFTWDLQFPLSSTTILILLTKTKCPGRTHLGSLGTNLGLG